MAAFTNSQVTRAILTLLTDADTARRIVQGGADESIQTAGGLVPTLAKVMKDLGESSAEGNEEFMEALRIALTARADALVDEIEVRVNEDVDGIAAQAAADAGIATTAATSAGNSASAAGTAAGDAADSATSASADAAAANASKNLAYAWAVQLDTPVAEGLYSARHYAAAAQASADSIAAGPVFSVNGMSGAVTINKGTVGLPLVSNLAPEDMPVSQPAWEVFDAKADLVEGKVPTAQLQTTDGINEGTTNLFHTAARVRGVVLTGIAFTVKTAVAAVDSIIVAVGKLQAQITDLYDAAIMRTGANGAARIPVGTNAQRPANEKGLFRFNDDGGRFEGNNGTAWGSLGGAAGGGNDALFYQVDKTLNNDYTIPGNQAAFRPGGLVIADGKKLTIEDGGSLTIV